MVVNVLIFFDPVKGQKFSCLYVANNLFPNFDCFLAHAYQFTLLFFLIGSFGRYGTFLQFSWLMGQCQVVTVAGICPEFQSIFLGAHNILFLCFSKVKSF